MVEARGIEPLSENLSTKLSPGAFGQLDLPQPSADRQARGRGSTLVHGSVKCERAAHVHCYLMPERKPQYSTGGQLHLGSS